MLDAVIIGSGPAGYACAIRVCQLGGKVVIIEKGSPGGICTNYGCIPKLSMHASAQLISKLKRAGEFGVDIKGFSIDFPRIMARKKKVVDVSTKGLLTLLGSYGIGMRKGTGKIAGSGKVEIEETGKIVSARNILIATGSHAMDIPNVNGIKSDSMFTLETLPKSLAIIGAGYIGVEFATTFQKFGSDVTLIEMADRILPGEDEDVSETLQRIMERSGIKILTGSKVLASDGHSVQLETPKGKQSVNADIVLVAVGREPNINQEELDAVGIKYDRKGIAVDSGLRTNVEGIYAAGDVTGIAMVAHVAYQQGVIAAENMMGKKSEISYHLIPNVIFSTPEVASVGKTDKTCSISKFPLAASGAARAFGSTEGFIKICSCDGKINSVSIIAEDASDLIAEAVMAIQKGVTVDEIEKIIHAHPTLPEAFMEAVEAVTGKALHLPKG